MRVHQELVYDIYTGASALVKDCVHNYGHMLVGSQEYKLNQNPSYFSQRVFAIQGDSHLRHHVISTYINGYASMPSDLTSEAIQRACERCTSNKALRDFALFLRDHDCYLSNEGLSLRREYVWKLDKWNENERSLGTIIEAIVGISLLYKGTECTEKLLNAIYLFGNNTKEYLSCCVRDGFDGRFANNDYQPSHMIEPA